MILGTGIDILSIDRILQIMQKYNNKFVNKILTKNEIELMNTIEYTNNNNNFNQKLIFLAKRFSAKEAFSKAIGTGICNQYLSFQDIDIYHNILGKPMIKNNTKFIVLINQINQNNNQYINNINIHLSISDEKFSLITNVIIESVDIIITKQD